MISDLHRNARRFVSLSSSYILEIRVQWVTVTQLMRRRGKKISFQSSRCPTPADSNHKDPICPDAVRIQQCSCIGGESCHLRAQNHFPSYSHEYHMLPLKFHSAAPHPHEPGIVSTPPLTPSHTAGRFHTSLQTETRPSSCFLQQILMGSFPSQALGMQQWWDKSPVFMELSFQCSRRRQAVRNQIITKLISPRVGMWWK